MKKKNRPKRRLGRAQREALVTDLDKLLVDAQNFAQNRQFAQAKDLFLRLNKVVPNRPEVLQWLGIVSLETGDAPAAVGYLKESVENADIDDPALGVMRHHLALAYEADGDKEQAAKVLRTAIADLEERQRAIRSQGRTPQSPPWESEVRGMLDRLSAS